LIARREPKLVEGGKNVQLLHLLGLEVFEGSQVVAGEKGLHREVTWVNMMEILDSLEQLQSGELLISTGYGLTEESPLVVDLIRKLNEKNLAGIAIQPGYYIKSIPRKILDQANELDFPVIHLKPKITFGKVTKAILDFLTKDTMSGMGFPASFPSRALDSWRSSILEEFFDDLLNGNFHSYNEILARSGPVGLEIFSSYKVAVVDCSRYLQGKRENPDSLLAKIRNLIISHPFAPENMHSRIRGNQVVLMYFSEYSKEEEDSFFRNISSTLEGGGHSNLLCTGIGKPTKNWQEFKDSYYQAIIALEIGQSILSDLRIVRYEDLGLYRLLCQIKNRRVLRDYVEESVLPLFEYDARCKSDLCETLRVFLEKGSQQETADTLVIHRQTLIYRLRKISEILQKDLSDPKIRMELYVGLLILDIADMKPLG